MKIVNENGRDGIEEIAEYQNLRVVALLESMKKDDPKTYGIIAMSLTRGSGFLHLEAEDASPFEILEGVVKGASRVLLAITDKAPIGVRKDFAQLFVNMVNEEVKRLCQ